MRQNPEGNGFITTFIEILKENARPFGILITIVALLLAFRQAEVLAFELLLHALVVAGLLLAIHQGDSGATKSQDLAMIKAQADSIAEFKSATGTIRSAINQALENEKILARLRREAAEEQKVMQDLRAELEKERGSRREEVAKFNEMKDKLHESSSKAEALRAQLATLQAEIGALQSAGDAKLARLLPEGVLDSSIGNLVRWSATGASDRGDPIAAMILASLQSMAAVKRCNLPDGDVAGHLRALGTSLERLATSQNWDPKRSSETFAQWCVVLNNLAWNDYILFVPALGTPVDLEKMSGRTSGNVTRVLCWGILQKRSNKLVRPAEVA